MAVTVNKSSNTGENRKLYYGIDDFSVLCVNPTQKEAVQKGINLKEEPKYFKEEDGTLRLDFFVAHKLIGTLKHTIWLREPKMSMTSKYQWIDKYGGTTWFEKGAVGNSPYFDYSTGRMCYQGEEEMTQFIKCLANAKKNDECRIDSIPQMFKNNDYDELQGLVESCEGRKVKMLLGVKEDKFQVFFNKCYMKSSTKKDNYSFTGTDGQPVQMLGYVAKFEQVFNANKDYIKADFGIPPYDFKEYVVGAPVVNTAVPVSDLPF